MNIPAIIWLVLLVIFLLAEAATVSVVSTWFAGGALVAMVAALLGAKTPVQIVLFFAVSVGLLAMLRPVVKKHLKPKLVATNADALIGKTCLVTEEIDNLAGFGRVKVGDVTWSARSESGEKIPAGSQVKILKIQGVKVIVEKIKEVEVV